jgi:hypothetical protein
MTAMSNPQKPDDRAWVYFVGFLVAFDVVFLFCFLGFQSTLAFQSP